VSLSLSLLFFSSPHHTLSKKARSPRILFACIGCRNLFGVLFVAFCLVVLVDIYYNYFDIVGVSVVVLIVVLVVV
jgi:hypothetical protein